MSKHHYRLRDILTHLPGVKTTTINKAIYGELGQPGSHAQASMREICTLIRTHGVERFQFTTRDVILMEGAAQVILDAYHAGTLDNVAAELREGVPVTIADLQQKIDQSKQSRKGMRTQSAA